MTNAEKFFMAIVGSTAFGAFCYLAIGLLPAGYTKPIETWAYIEANRNNSVWCPDRNLKLTGAWVHVHNNGRIKYVQTVADGRKTDNLLSLPNM
jgi:Protein of unknown function (DUF3892)